jgi:hypothetical protein
MMTPKITGTYQEKGQQATIIIVAIGNTKRGDEMSDVCIFLPS